MKTPENCISDAYIRSRGEAYQTDAPRNGGRKRAEDVNSWGQPLCQPLVATARFVKFLNLILQDGEDGGGRVANLQLGGKRMCEKVLLGLLLIGLKSGLEDSLES